MRQRFFLLWLLPVLLIVSTLLIHLFEYQLAENPDEQYGSLFNSFYWTVVTVATVGFGDLSPKTFEGRFFTLFVIAAGVVQYSLLVSILTTKLAAYRSARERGLDPVDMKGHILICSDQAGWITEILNENARAMSGRLVAIVSPTMEHPLLTTDFNQIRWISGQPHHLDTLMKASADKAAVAYVYFPDNNLTLMTVQQLQTLSKGRIITQAQYLGRDFRRYFADVGCDHAVDPYDLCVPMMMQAYRSQGGPSWIRVVVRRSEGHRLDTVPVPVHHVEKTWLDFVKEVKAQTGSMPLGIVMGEVVLINPAPHHLLHRDNKVIQLSSPPSRALGDQDSHGIDVLGMEDLRIEGHLLISSDNPIFIERMLLEMSHCELEDHIVVLTNLPPMEQMPDNLSLEWIQGSSNSEEAFHKGRAELAKVAFVDHLHDGQTLIAVLRLEQETDGDIFTIATFRDDDFDLHLLRVGCDFCLKYDDLIAPMLAQSATNSGLSNLITQILSQELSTQSLFVRRLSYDWKETSWLNTVVTVKSESEQLPVGLIRRGSNELLVNPHPDLRVSSGDSLIFLTKEVTLRHQQIFEPTHLDHESPKAVSPGRAPRELSEGEALVVEAIQKLKDNGDPLQAYRMLLQAANLNHPEAKYQLGILHFKGRGIPKNLDEAHYWFREAALSGDEKAQSVLATIKILREAEKRFQQHDTDTPEFNPELLAQLDATKRRWFARMVVSMVQADGRIDLHERAFVHSAIQLIADPAGVQELEEAFLLGNPIPIEPIEVAEDLRLKILESLLNVATIDRHFDEAEESMLRQIGTQIGCEPQVIEQLVELGHSRAQQFHSTQLHAPNARARI